MGRGVKRLTASTTTGGAVQRSLITIGSLAIVEIRQDLKAVDLLVDLMRGFAGHQEVRCLAKVVAELYALPAPEVSTAGL